MLKATQKLVKSNKFLFIYVYDHLIMGNAQIATILKMFFYADFTIFFLFTVWRHFKTFIVLFINPYSAEFLKWNDPPSILGTVHTPLSF